MALSRRLVLLTPLLLAACGDDGPPREFKPLRYDFLTRLQLNVAAIGFADLPPPGPLDSVSPVPAAQALRQMAEDRLAAGGSSGKAVIKIEEARIVRSGSTLDGSMAIHLDIVAADGQRAGFAEARVARQLNGFGRDLRGGLYDITKQMLDDMNVELEFELRRSLRDYLQATTAAPAPAAVQQQDLAPPISTP
jgi:hypothetical protein